MSQRQGGRPRRRAIATALIVFGAAFALFIAIGAGDARAQTGGSQTASVAQTQNETLLSALMFMFVLIYLAQMVFIFRERERERTEEPDDAAGTSMFADKAWRFVGISILAPYLLSLLQAVRPHVEEEGGGWANSVAYNACLGMLLVLLTVALSLISDAARTRYAPLLNVGVALDIAVLVSLIIAGPPAYSSTHILVLSATLALLLASAVVSGYLLVLVRLKLTRPEKPN